ncbi:MAG: hypothetical protein U0Q19_11015 [Kineosporiaceae bacterium]
MTTRRILVLGFASIVAIGVASAGASASTAATAPAATNATLLQHPARVMAGNCFQCHGTDGKGGPFEGIAGEPAAELYNELKELQRNTGGGDEAIMGVHARAYTDAQLRSIADYFSKVR